MSTPPLIYGFFHFAIKRSWRGDCHFKFWTILALIKICFWMFTLRANLILVIMFWKSGILKRMYYWESGVKYVRSCKLIRLIHASCLRRWFFFLCTCFAPTMKPSYGKGVLNAIGWQFCVHTTWGRLTARYCT
jgi:hypothetical protein